MADCVVWGELHGSEMTWGPPPERWLAEGQPSEMDQWECCGPVGRSRSTKVWSDPMESWQVQFFNIFCNLGQADLRGRSAKYNAETLVRQSEENCNV